MTGFPSNDKAEPNCLAIATFFSTQLQVAFSKGPAFETGYVYSHQIATSIRHRLIGQEQAIMYRN